MLNLGVTVNSFSEFAEDAAFFGLTVSEDELKEVPEYDWNDLVIDDEITFSGEGMSDEEIAEAIFEQDALSEYELEDYEINSVEIMKDADRESLVSDFYPEAGDEDIFAVIRYDVKPYEEFYEYWTAGNGEEDGEWVRNKDACVYIEHTDNGYSMSSYGTGW